MPKLRLFACLLLVLVLVIFNFASKVSKAAISSCDGEVDPTTVLINASPNLTFTLNNNDSNAIVWLKFTAPSSNFTITDGSADGMTATIDSGTVIRFTSGNFPGSSTKDFNVSVSTGSSAVAAASWTVQASDSSDGSNPTTCTGSFSVAISSPPADVNPPTISSLTITDVSQTSVKITWTTDEAATSVVNYGTTASYGSTKSDSTLVTSHSVEVTGLSSNTTYHYSIQSADADGNSTETNDNTFVSSKASTTVTTTTTTTTTVTKTATDTSLPAVSITTDLSGVFSQSPTISGKASDDVGVTQVEYSIDGGRNWLPVDDFGAIGAKSTTFEFTPEIIDDGNYKIKVRATDPSGNKVTSKEYTLIIDRLPPQVGGALFSLGPMILTPDSSGVIKTITGLDTSVTLSASGGPVSLDLFSDSQLFSMVKNVESGFWKGVLSFAKEGTFFLTTKSVDGAQNITEEKLATIISLPAGKVMASGDYQVEAVVSVFIYEPTLGKFLLWDGEAFGQENPQKTDADGAYKLILPSGKYYLDVSASGFKGVRSSIFELNKPTPVNQNFVLEKSLGISLGGLFIGLPDFRSRVDEFETSQLTTELLGDNKAVGSVLPDFVLETQETTVSNISILGKPTVISFVSTWVPTTSDQIGALEAFSQDYESVNVYAVAEQEGRSKIETFKKRGGYKLNIVADPDGLLIQDLGIRHFPSHVFLDRKGVVQKVAVGFLTKDELVDNLLD